MTQLATIQKISELTPIQNADKLVLASMDGNGWKCIVSKDEFKIGDMAVYIETDSRVPPIKEFAFLEKRHYKVKTIKLRGVYSQGLIVSLAILQGKVEPKEGLDVTQLLDIHKITSHGSDEYKALQKHGAIFKFCMRFRAFRAVRRFIKSRGPKAWPEGVPVTDEVHVQNMPGVLVVIPDVCIHYITEKLDGQSATYFYKPRFIRGIYKQCSRELVKRPGDRSNWDRMADKYHIQTILKCFNAHLYIQGEICGPGIQGNKYILQEQELFIFNIFSFTRGEFFHWSEMVEFCQFHGLQTVPLVEIKSFSTPPTIAELMEMSKGMSLITPTQPREGIVIRPLSVLDRRRYSFKVVNPEFEA